MRCLLVIALLASHAYADDPVAAAKAWWDAAQKAGPVDYSVSATSEEKCKAIGHGKATEKTAQTKLHECLAKVTAPLDWKVGKLKDVRATNSSLKPAKTDRIVAANNEVGGANLQIYIAVDPKGVVRRLWVAESYFE
jgi:hypothetical protein